MITNSCSCQLPSQRQSAKLEWAAGSEQLPEQSLVLSSDFLLQREEAETKSPWAVGRSMLQWRLHVKSAWNSELPFGVKFPAKEKFLKVPPLHHSPSKFGMKWFHLTGLIWSQGWSLFCNSISLFLAEAVGWHCCQSYDCFAEVEVLVALGCPGSWGQPESPEVSVLPWGEAKL